MRAQQSRKEENRETGSQERTGLLQEGRGHPQAGWGVGGVQLGGGGYPPALAGTVSFFPAQKKVSRIFLGRFLGIPNDCSRLQQNTTTPDPF